MTKKNFNYERNPIKEKFYRGQKWKRCAKSFADSKHWICEQCGNVRLWNAVREGKVYEKDFARMLQVHHKKEVDETKILNGSDDLYDWNNLELLCVFCHNEERKQICAKGYELKDGKMIKIV